MKDKEKQKEKDRLLDLALLYYGGSILKSSGMEKEKSLIQHGTVSTYQHSVNVARTSLKIARRLNLDSLKFSTIEAVVKSIGLPREDICLHCFDGSSAYTLEQENK